MVDHVGAAVDLALGEFAALYGFVARSTRRAGHVLKHFRVLLGVLDALDVAAGELPDERDVHPAYESDLVGLGGLGREEADQERALVLLEDDRLHVRLLDDRVDDGELHVRELVRHLLQGRLLAESDGEDRTEAVAGEAAQRLLALGVVLGFEIPVLGAGLLLEALSPGGDPLVEGLIELAAEIVDDGGLEDRSLREGRRRREGETRERETEFRDGHEVLFPWRLAGLEAARLRV